WDFSKKCQEAFSKLKEEFTHAQVLTQWLPDSWMILETDTSDSSPILMIKMCIILNIAQLLMATWFCQYLSGYVDHFLVGTWTCIKTCRRSCTCLSDQHSLSSPWIPFYYFLSHISYIVPIMCLAG
ncbi:hypothetical protein L208DRAFT_1250232, partial [Tricholoma matsutake]